MKPRLHIGPQLIPPYAETSTTDLRQHELYHRCYRSVKIRHSVLTTPLLNCCRRPHSWAPDKPITGNIVGNKVTAPLDHLRDAARWGTGPIPSVVIRPGNGQTA
jgi:hypothetical protein